MKHSSYLAAMAVLCFALSTPLAQASGLSRIKCSFVMFDKNKTSLIQSQAQINVNADTISRMQIFAGNNVAADVSLDTQLNLSTASVYFIDDSKNWNLIGYSKVRAITDFDLSTPLAIDNRSVLLSCKILQD